MGDDEIFWVEFYQDGEIIKQYSYDILEYVSQLENDEFHGEQRVLLDKSAKLEYNKVTEVQFIQKNKKQLPYKNLFEWRNYSGVRGCF